VNDQGLRALFSIRAGVLARHPELARGAEQSFVVWDALRDVGLACQVDYQDRSLVVSLAAEEGGDATGPHPEQLMRAALGAALAQGYKIWGARLGVAITRVELAVRCQVDARGRLGIEHGVAIGWECVDVDVTVTSPADESQIRTVVETANRLSPVLANLSRDVRQRHRLTVIAERTVPSDVTPDK
jgi:uncharacterized OsmC-like protein